jgi:hypothetical protein
MFVTLFWEIVLIALEAVTLLLHPQYTPRRK